VALPGVDVNGLPHAHPFVMLDRVTDVVPGERARGVKCVSRGESWVPGHFPGEPVLPAVLMLEAMAQLAGVMGGEGAAVLGGVDRARFRRRVVPGDRVELEAKLVARTDGAFRARVEARVEGDLVAEAELLLVRSPA